MCRCYEPEAEAQAEFRWKANVNDGDVDGTKWVVLVPTGVPNHGYDVTNWGSYYIEIIIAAGY